MEYFRNRSNIQTIALRLRNHSFSAEDQILKVIFDGSTNYEKLSDIFYQ